MREYWSVICRESAKSDFIFMASNSLQFQQLKHTNVKVWGQAAGSILRAPSVTITVPLKPNLCKGVLAHPWNPLHILWEQVAPKVHGGSSCFSFWKRIDEKGGFGRNHWAVSILPPRNHQMHPARSGMKCRWQNSLWVSPWECRKCRRASTLLPLGVHGWEHSTSSFPVMYQWRAGSDQNAQVRGWKT